MVPALIVLLQSVSGPPVPAELRKAAARSAAPCPVTRDGEEIVVCARPTDQRLARLPEPDTRAPEDALSFRLPGGGKGNVHAFQRSFGGATGQGVAVTLTVPLGKRQKKKE